MPVVPRTRSYRNSIHGLAVVVSLLIGISVAIGTDDQSAADAADSQQEGGLLTVTSSPAPSPPAFPGTIPPAGPQPSPNGTIAPGARDLALYENGGTHAISAGAPGLVRDGVMNQTRAFLLRKWNARQPGRLTLVAPNLAGRPETRNFFIERDSMSGAWKITIEMVDSDAAEFYFVEEIGVDSDGIPVLGSTPPNAAPGNRVLHLKLTATSKSGLLL